ncbi:hypothetical protein [Streptomyces iconiensis]|uniref:Tat (Twin-arginine translocation) pathway signal sequence n=1 Tax=Streptomyces iconiensis TaxID=1384038 RepID=A0ABT7AAV7_9ACTN|nr:hypothetical protein [Streptomyces iconiensis]MDJ1138465.1 hypothetical protein [Streptomyces iconiensis]
MSINRRRLLSGAAAAASAGALGTLATPARGAEPRLEHFELGLLDANPDKCQIEWVNTGKVERDDRLIRQREPLKTGGWQPLELKYRWLPWINGDESGGVAYMIVGGDTENGRVAIHRQSDGERLAWFDGLSMYPHSIEYLPSANAVVVVGTRTPGLPGGGGRRGGCYQLFTAPRNSGGVFTPVGEPRQFRQAHGAAWQYHQDNPGDPGKITGTLWMYGYVTLQGYRVTGWRESVQLEEVPELRVWDRAFNNGHDLTLDGHEPAVLWATGTKRAFRIDVSGSRPQVVDHFERWVKSYSRHSSGRGIWTSSQGVQKPNVYGSDRVNLEWPKARYFAPDNASWIYKARTTDWLLPGQTDPR